MADPITLDGGACDCLDCRQQAEAQAMPKLDHGAGRCQCCGSMDELVGRVDHGGRWFSYCPECAGFWLWGIGPVPDPCPSLGGDRYGIAERAIEIAEAALYEPEGGL